MPRRKPDTVTEVRASLGTFERGLEESKVGADYAQSAAVAVGGIAQGLGRAVGGLGIGGGVLLGAIYFKGEIDEALDAIKKFLPNPEYKIGSALWVSSWGDTPSEQVMQDNDEPHDETAVDVLVNDRGETLAGQSIFDAYRNGSVGRDAYYTHYIQTNTVGLTPAQVANFMHYPSARPPPLSQGVDGYGYQISIRETTARRVLAWRLATLGVSFLWDWNTEVSDVAGYIADPMLDWAACKTYPSSNAIISKSSVEEGARLIQLYMNWRP